MLTDQWQKIRRLNRCEGSAKRTDFLFCTSFVLFSKAVGALGQARFNKIHDYLIEQRSRQRTDSTLDDARINEDLRNFDAKPSDCFLVDQLVFLELVSNEK